MEVRRLGPSDAEALLASRFLFDHDLSAEATRAYVADDRNVVLLAFDGSAPVGFLRGTTLAQLRSTRSQMFLYEIGVVATHRRRGVGKALVTALLELCRAQGYAEVFVLTDPGNAAAVRLYQATGALPETPADRMYVYRLNL